MIKFNNTIVQFGFGAVGKSFFEKLHNEIKYDETKYFIITRDETEFESYINMGGITENFIICDINKDNFEQVFKKYLNSGDLLIDFADTVGTKDITKFCADNNIMYLNTGEADWPDNWYSIFEENIKKNKLREYYKTKPELNKHPIVLQHGNNPGLVSHFVKEAIDYISKTQHKHNKILKQYIKNNEFNKASQLLGIKQIHVNDIDLQELNDNDNNTLNSTWCIDSFFFEMLSESTQNIGPHEIIDFKEECNLVDIENGFLEHKNIAVNTKCHTYYPNGHFEGHLVPHEETITIANSLEVKENNKVIYRPSVMFIYSPCNIAESYFINNKVNNYPNPDPNKPLDIDNPNGDSIVRGYKYPKLSKIAYKENIRTGTEYVGILLIGDNFDPVWVGNRVETPYLYKKKDSYWQTPTITPVAMSALAATCWMIKNKETGGIYFPDDIKDYKYIIKLAEKYISKTIYKTFDKQTISNNLNINFNNIQSKDIYIKKENE